MKYSTLLLLLIAVSGTCALASENSNNSAPEKVELVQSELPVQSKPISKAERVFDAVAALAVGTATGYITAAIDPNSSGYPLENTILIFCAEYMLRNSLVNLLVTPAQENSAQNAQALSIARRASWFAWIATAVFRAKGTTLNSANKSKK